MELQKQVLKQKQIIDDLLFKEEVFSIIGAAFEVHNNLGNGFLEPVYQEAFEIELSARQNPFESQSEISILYKEQLLQKKYRADLIAFDKILIELKATDHLIPVDESQIINYLKSTKYRLGALINFGSSKLEWKRLIY